MLGGDYLNHLWRGGRAKLKSLVRPLLRDGIGDRMDKGNLWVIPGFTLFVFAILWTTKLSKIALEESTCMGASIYNFEGTQLDDDAKRHCETAKRYYVGVNEQFSLDPAWRIQREVKNPEWILWFWGPIVFIMYVLTRFVWTLLMENQGINFPNVISASQSVTVENEGIVEVDEERLLDRLSVIAENFRTACSSRAFGAFLAFEFSLVLAPLVLLLFILPLMIGPNYRTWGFDIIRAWWDGRDWQGNTLVPFFELTDQRRERNMLVPLVPRITYCDYHFSSLGNTNTLTYRCYLDANWHERTALFTWIMLVFLTLINVGNLCFWTEWAIRMRSKSQRRKWVTRKWLNPDGFSETELPLMPKFAESFQMGQLLYFYFIECHTDRVVASAFCTALYGRWLERRKRQRGSMGLVESAYQTPPPAPQNEGELKEITSPLGWKLSGAGYPQMLPIAPFPTPSVTAFSEAPTVAIGGVGRSTPKSPPEPPSTAVLDMGPTPRTTAALPRTRVGGRMLLPRFGPASNEPRLMPEVEEERQPLTTMREEESNNEREEGGGEGELQKEEVEEKGEEEAQKEEEELVGRRGEQPEEEAGGSGVGGTVAASPSKQQRKKKAEGQQRAKKSKERHKT